MPAIHVTEWTKETLDDIKEDEGHATYDSVVRTILKDADRT